ncbi:MAG TPA: response regulator [Candidatus Sulfotelmatobacter sp.]|nr:response regulator [Candidatus Sulfotelmatobacter sp.]
MDDNEDDAFACRRALQKARLSCRLHHLGNGQEAMDYLSGAGPYANREQYPMPVAVISDLHLPRVSGFELLAWIREQEEFQSLPVIIHSGSVYPGDKPRACQLGASHFVEKAPSCVDLLEVLNPLLARAESKKAA